MPEVTPRDLQILRCLYECRVATLRHLADLFFDGRYEATKKVAQRLAAHRLTNKRERAIGQPAVLYLSKRGYDVLREKGGLDGLPIQPWERLSKRVQVSESTLNHELDVLTFRAAIESAIRTRPGLSVQTFTTWPRLSQFTAKRPLPGIGQRSTVTQKPDGFFVLQETHPDGSIDVLYFFVEVDRSTETLQTLRAKMHSYRDYWQRGGLGERFGDLSGEAKKWPFRVLWTVKTDARLRNVQEAFLNSNPPFKGLAWIALFEEASTRPLESIWSRPQDGPETRSIL